MRFLFFFITITFVFFITNSCVDDVPEFSTKFNLRICDDPNPNLKSFIIDIQAIQVKITSDNQMAGWKTLDKVKPGMYDLLKFNNGKDTLLTSEDLPSGGISQLKIVLGPNNKIVFKDETIKPLYLLASELSLLKINIDAQLEENIDYNLYLDVDVNRSLYIDKTGTCFFYPKIKSFQLSNTGGVLGNVTPKTENVFATIVYHNDTLATSISKDGYFFIRGIKPGENYKLNISPQNTTKYKTVTPLTVEVIEGKNTAYNIVLKEKEKEN